MTDSTSGRTYKAIVFLMAYGGNDGKLIEKYDPIAKTPSGQSTLSIDFKLLKGHPRRNSSNISGQVSQGKDF
jgi:hypothetical protein